MFPLSPEQGSLTILRRSSSRTLGRSQRFGSAASDDATVAETQQDVAAQPDSPEAVEKAVQR